MMQVADELSIEELKLNLRTYREQLQQVTELLAEDPSNSEYAEMEKELREVIELTEELLATAKQAESAGAGAKTDPSVSSPKQQSQSRVSPKQMSLWMWATDFLLVLKFKLFGVMMENGMMPQL